MRVVVFLCFLVMSVLVCETGFAQACDIPTLQADSTFSQGSTTRYVWRRCISSTMATGYNQRIVSHKDLFNVSITTTDPSNPGPFTQAMLAAGTALNVPINSLGSFEVTITGNVGATCAPFTIQGKIINDRQPGVGFQKVSDGLCAPNEFSFRNLATNVSPNTRFKVEWGDGTTNNYDYTSVGELLKHTYDKGAARICPTEVKFWTINDNCPANGSGLVTFDFSIYDIDSVRVSPSAVALCETGGTVTFNRSTKQNCNNQQERLIRWEWTDPVTGNQVIKDWSSAIGGQSSQTITFPNAPIGTTWIVTMLDSSFCGKDKATAVVEIVARPAPQFTIQNDNQCPGVKMLFQNNTTGSYAYQWDFGEGAGWETKETVNGYVEHAFQTSGLKTVRLRAFRDSFSGVCEAVTTSIVHVKSGVTAGLYIPKKEFCLDGAAQVSVEVRNRSINYTADSRFNFDFGVGSAGRISNKLMPSDSVQSYLYSQHGSYEIRLDARNYPTVGEGCAPTSAIDKIFIYPSPLARLRVNTTVCQGSAVVLRDSSRVASGDARGLSTGWNHISWHVDFGDGSFESSAQNVTGSFNTARVLSHIYANPGTYTITYSVSTPYSCAITETRTITVLPIATPSFRLESRVCDASQITFVNTTVGNATLYVWEVWRNGVLFKSIQKTGKEEFTEILPYNFNGVSTSYEVKLKAVAGEGETACIAFAPDQGVVIPASPQARFSISPNRGCSPLKQVSFTDESVFVPEGSLMTWNFGNGTEVTLLKGQNPEPQHYINTTQEIKEYQVKLTIKPQGSLACSYERTEVITVYPLPSFVFAAPDTVCSGSEFSVSVSGNSLSTGSLAWSFNDGSAAETGIAQVRKTVVNNGTAPLLYTITLQGATQFGCTGTSSKTIVVMPKPSIVLTVPEPVCGERDVTLSVTLQNAAAVSGVTYIWNFGDGSDPVTTTASSVVHKYINNTTSDLSRLVRVRAVSSAGCASTGEVTITVKPRVTALFNALDPLAGCTDYTIRFNNTSTGSSIFVWKIRKLSETSGQGHGPWESYQNSTDRNFVYTFTNSTPNKVRYEVHLEARSAGVNACSDEYSEIVTIFPKPKATFTISTLNPANGCSPLLVTFNAGASEGGTIYRWNFGNGTEIHTDKMVFTRQFINTGITDLLYNIQLTVENEFGCKSIAANDLTVKPLVTAFFTFESDSVGCSPLKIKFRNRSSISAQRFIWRYSVNNEPYIDFSEAQHPEFIFQSLSPTAETVYVVELVATDASGICRGVYRREVKVLPKPVARFTFETDNFCAPADVRFSQLQSAGGINYKWYKKLSSSTDFPATPFHTAQSNTADFLHNFQNSTTGILVYNIRLVVTSALGCTDTVSQDISIKPQVTAAFSTPYIEGCSPFRLDFENKSSASANFFEWIIKDPNGAESVYTNRNPSHLFTIPGIHQVRLKARFSISNDPCIAEHVSTVTVFPMPKPTFNLEFSGECSDLAVKFNRSEAQNADSVIWLISHGSVTDTLRGRSGADWKVFDSVFVNTSTRPVVYTVRMLALSAKGCSAVSMPRTFKVNPKVVAALEAPNEGCSPLRVAFVNKSINPGGSYLWNFGQEDITVSPTVQNPEVVYTYHGSGDTTYVVSLRARSGFDAGCDDVITHKIKVYGTPKPSFQVLSPNPMNLPANTVKLKNTTPQRDAWEYTWTFGDGRTLNSKEEYVEYVYANLASSISDSLFVITLTASGPSGLQCAVIYIDTLVILPPAPVADFAPDTAGCQDLVVNFRNKSLYGMEGGYHWEFGDGNSSTVQHPTHVYRKPGTYTVTLKVKGLGGQDIKKKTDYIKVYTVPSISFNTLPREPRKVKVPTESLYCFSMINNEDLAEGYSYEWDFGDGNKAYTRNPEHKYREAGEYFITLKVTTKNGCQAVYTDSTAVVAEAGGTLLIPNAFSPNPSGPSRTRLDPSRPSEGNDIFYPIVEGATEIFLQVFSRWGELIFESRELGYGWDGYYKGSICQQDVYVYKVEARFSDGSRQSKIGDVTVVR